MADQTTTIVVTDANVLINLVHIGRLDLLGLLSGLDFVIPEEVTAEITDPGQLAAVQTALDTGCLAELRITDHAEIQRSANLNTRFGKGESACLALAESRGWWLASDEKRAFRRTAIATIGEAAILTTPDLIVRAIREGLTTVEEADGWKAVLAERRFKMKFDSFADIV